MTRWSDSGAQKFLRREGQKLASMGTPRAKGSNIDRKELYGAVIKDEMLESDPSQQDDI